MSSIVDYYNQYNEAFRFQRHSRKIEFMTTVKALSPYFNHSRTVLELGAGSGAYSFYYAKQGHQVVATDLVPSNVDQMNNKRQQEELDLTTHVINATDLSLFDDDSFDIVLCLGPYYHIIDEQQRERCIAESLRVLKKDGILAIAYLNKYNVLPMLIKKQPEFVNEYIIEHVINKGYIEGADSRTFWIDSHYTTPEEVESYLHRFNVTILDHLATDGLSHTLSEEVDALSNETFELYCQYHYSTCRQPSILGISAHGLVVVQK